MSNIWKILSEVVEAERRPVDPMSGPRMAGDLMYRGAQMKYRDLRRLAQEAGEPEAPDSQGGYMDLVYKADPSVWKRWSRTMNLAVAAAATEPAKGGAGKMHPSDKDLPRPASPFAGRDVDVDRGQYDTIMNPLTGKVAKVTQKQAAAPYGGPIAGGEARPDAEFDVVMAGIPGDKEVVVKRIAWSPSVGSFDERSSRLSSLMAGKKVPPPTKFGPTKPGSELPSKQKTDEPSPLSRPTGGLKSPVKDTGKSSWDDAAGALFGDKPRDAGGPKVSYVKRRR